tara:strand:- start:3040 stop:4359 length:1320 start_codon:yes stop_codon:yes gene_type:complete
MFKWKTIIIYGFLLLILLIIIQYIFNNNQEDEKKINIPIDHQKQINVTKKQINSNPIQWIVLANRYKDKDIKKYIYYLKIATEHNIPVAYKSLGDIYYYGLPGIEVELDKAKSIYEDGLIYTNKDSTLKSYFTCRLNEINYIKKLEEDRIKRLKENKLRIHNTPIRYETNTIYVNNNQGQLNLEDIGLYDVNENDEETLVNNIINLNNNQNNIINDKQNVHDNGVQRTIHKTCNNLKNNTDLHISPEKTKNQIKNLILQEKDEEKLNKLLRVFETIDNASTNPIYNIGLNENETLHLIWNRIQSNTDIEKRHLMEENLKNNLLDCIEDDQIVCPTGRANRVIDSLNKIDECVDIKPSWALKKEMLDKTARIREEMIKNSSEEDKKKLESFDDTEENQEFEKEFNNKLKKKIIDTFSIDYNGLMTKEEIMSEVQEWINCI